MDMADELQEGDGSTTWVIDNERISLEQQRLIFVAYKRFSDDGRPLAREEIFEIVYKILGKHTLATAFWNHIHRRLDTFDDDSDPLTVKYANYYAENGQPLLAEVDNMFRALLKEDLEMEDRSKNCKGLTKRLPYMDNSNREWPTWDFQKVRFDQLLLSHALAKGCKDDQGNSLGRRAGYYLLQEQVFGRNCFSTLFETLLHDNSDVAKKITHIMDTDQVFRAFFGNLSYKKYQDYNANEGLPGRLFVMHGIPPQSDDDPKGEGKGKQKRERETSSNSPGRKASGKRQEKRPRRDGGKS